VTTFQRVSNSSFGIYFSRFVGRTLPPTLGHLVATSLARAIVCQHDSSQVRAVRANQWVAQNQALNRPQLNRAVQAVFRHGGRCIYEMYHYYQNPAGLAKKVELSPRALEVIERGRSRRGGMVLASLHLSNFDLGLQALAQTGLEALVLTIPQPPSGYQMQNQQRTLKGIEAIPFSFSTLFRAAEHLKSGRMVLTGVERPVFSQKYPVRFFGRPALLPVAHVQLALLTRVPVVVIACHMRPNGTYLVDASEEIAMRALPDRAAETARNAEAVLEQLEALIRAYPSQWLMYYPVWPETLEEMP
jgi:phosphatidylinositol dimannoside acyltransferase